MINMAIKVNGESWNKSAERMCMCGYARARALPTTGPDTLYVHTPDHTERVGSFWYHLSCGLFCGLGINFCSLQPRAGFVCVIEDHSSTSEGQPIRAFPKSFEPRIWRAS